MPFEQGFVMALGCFRETLLSFISFDIRAYSHEPYFFGEIDIY
jgi:hypothetical protein